MEEELLFLRFEQDFEYQMHDEDRILFRFDMQWLQVGRYPSKPHDFLSDFVQVLEA